MTEKQRIMSGIQPTGHLHLGNYFGAVQNWVQLQETYECYYCVVNYHAITMPYQPKKLAQNSWDLVFNLLACGIKPETLFIQSMVPEHTELGWILSAFASYGGVTRMTQFKDKSRQSQEISKDHHISTALFTYPVLQAADILIYNAHFVPVGKDQQQHLELTRDIAQRFNTVTKSDYFVTPEPMYTKFAKIMSTADPTIKMSSSKGDKHNINLFGEPARVRKQIMSAVTDSGEQQSGEMSPGVANLFQLLDACGAHEAHQSLTHDYKAGQLKYSDLKNTVADVVVAYLEPFSARRDDLLSRRKEVKNEIKANGKRIRQIAIERLREVKALAGLV